MDEFIGTKHLLNTVKARIDVHNEFKKEYDKQLAFDFSLFQFFAIGENKISQVLAYFLDEKQNHGQGAIFLNEFIKTFSSKEIEVIGSINICEKRITQKKRIDIYIELNDFTIAIENKIWADDQPNQLKDYAGYLERKTKGNYLLLYLNPYGFDPSTKSINEAQKNSLIDQNKFKVISYKEDLINLINRWIVICEADNVSYFLKEFKKYLEIEFLGKNTLNMSKDIRAIIYNNEREVNEIVKEYKDIENEIISKLNAVGKELGSIEPSVDTDIIVSKSGLFNWNGSRIYKYSLSKHDNKIWIQFEKKEIHLLINYYLQEGTDVNFHEILSDLNFKNNMIVNHNQKISELVNVFLNHVTIVNESFKIYDKHFGS